MVTARERGGRAGADSGSGSGYGGKGKHIWGHRGECHGFGWGEEEQIHLRSEEFCG